ncbi:unnamed protein product [Larinioides sclopetarius]|uniref:SEC14-like protein 2 n=1 Tax=Larinioides sclopetarius TaxID=280406 RepID=A0AAV1ZBN3_9ARAC
MELADLSPEHIAVIEELKRRTMDCVTPKMLEDNYLFYRFAKARDFNLIQAESMLRKHICKRKELEIDTMLTDYKPPEVLVNYVSNSNLGFDKEGCIVEYVDGGRLDYKGLWNCAKKQDILQYFAYIIERDKDMLLKRYKKFGKHIFLSIFDFENLPYATTTHVKTLQYGIYFLKEYIDNYPETLKCAIIINDGWKKELLKLIDADVLPAFLGGNKTDPDGNPLCITFVKRGEPIPKSFYMANEREILRTDLEKLTILPFSKKEISFEVKEVNSDLEWEYDIKSMDIDFSLHFKEKTLDPVELIPKQRTDTCFGTEKGLLKCEKVGTYTIVLDNSYSWLYPKEVYFRAEVKPPKNDRSENSGCDIHLS